MKSESEEGEKDGLKIGRKAENRKKILETRIEELEGDIKQKENDKNVTFR